MTSHDFFLKVSDGQLLKVLSVLEVNKVPVAPGSHYQGTKQKLELHNLVLLDEYADFPSFPFFFFYTHRHTSDMNHHSDAKDRKIVLLSWLEMEKKERNRILAILGPISLCKKKRKVG